MYVTICNDQIRSEILLLDKTVLDNGIQVELYIWRSYNVRCYLTRQTKLSIYAKNLVNLIISSPAKNKILRYYIDRCF